MICVPFYVKKFQDLPKIVLFKAYCVKDCFIVQNVDLKPLLKFYIHKLWYIQLLIVKKFDSDSRSVLCRCACMHMTTRFSLYATI